MTVSYPSYLGRNWWVYQVGMCAFQDVAFPSSTQTLLHWRKGCNNSSMSPLMSSSEQKDQIQLRVNGEGAVWFGNCHKRAWTSFFPVLWGPSSLAKNPSTIGHWPVRRQQWETNDESEGNLQLKLGVSFFPKKGREVGGLRLHRSWVASVTLSSLKSLFPSMMFLLTKITVRIFNSLNIAGRRKQGERERGVWRWWWRNLPGERR